MVMENEPFPILPPTFSGNSRSVDVGNVFDWLRERTGSVWPSVVFHALCNGLEHALASA